MRMRLVNVGFAPDFRDSKRGRNPGCLVRQPGGEDGSIWPLFDESGRDGALTSTIASLPLIEEMHNVSGLADKVKTQKLECKGTSKSSG